MAGQEKRTLNWTRKKESRRKQEKEKVVEQEKRKILWGRTNLEQTVQQKERKNIVERDKKWKSICDTTDIKGGSIGDRTRKEKVMYKWQYVEKIYMVDQKKEKNKRTECKKKYIWC